jgi:hypothetical protein
MLMRSPFLLRLHTVYILEKIRWFNKAGTARPLIKSTHLFVSTAACALFPFILYQESYFYLVVVVYGTLLKGCT